LALGGSWKDLRPRPEVTRSAEMAHGELEVVLGNLRENYACSESRDVVKIGNASLERMAQQFGTSLGRSHGLSAPESLGVWRVGLFLELCTMWACLQP
jgi:hypothetical protein